jgi:hypothetical protein
LEVFKFGEVKDDLVELQRALFGTPLLSPFTSDEKGLRTLLCVLASYSFEDRFEYRDSRFINFELSVEALSEMKKPEFDERPWYTDERRVTEEIVGKCRGRAAFLTQDGRLGLAPKSAKPDDIVTVLLGCESAIILRPCPGDQFQVVGEGICHGFMDGEALLGPLPDRIERVLFESGVGRHTWTCIDRSTGVCDYEDPRLGKLPDGWKIGEHEEDDIWSMYGNDELGITDSDDPRLSPEALIERGVDLREFVLI